MLDVDGKSLKLFWERPQLRQKSSPQVVGVGGRLAERAVMIELEIYRQVKFPNFCSEAPQDRKSYDPLASTTTRYSEIRHENIL